MRFDLPMKQYAKALQRQYNRTPGPRFNLKRLKAAVYYKEAMDKICAITGPEGEVEGIIRRKIEETNVQLEP